MFYRVIFFLFVWIWSSLPVYALNMDAMRKAVNAELSGLDKTYRVYYNSETQRLRLFSVFHDAIVEGQQKNTDSAIDGSYLIIELDQASHDALLKEAFTIEPAFDYRQNRRQQLERTLEKFNIPHVSSQSFSIISPTAHSHSSHAVSFASTDPITIEDLPCFQTVEETFAIAQDLVDANPVLAELIDIGDSWEKVNGLGGYDLLVMKITNRTIPGDKPKLFIHSAMHAREWATAPLTLSFAETLIQQYGIDADITWVIDHHEIHILFHMNPDGRKIAEQRVSKRKNNNTNHCPSGGENIGVDLNRNFEFFWRESEDEYDFGFEYRTSDDECNETYRGASPASEPETQAVEAYIRSLFTDDRGESDDDSAPLTKQGLHIDVHSSGGLILYPFSHTDELGPNETQLATLARKLAFFNNYNPQPTGDLYLLDGNSESVSFGELGVPQLTFEIGSTFFENCESFESRIKPDNINALLYAAKIVGAPYLLPSGSDVVNIEPIGDMTGRVNLNEMVTLTATATDERYQTYRVQNGDDIDEPVEPVAAVEYTIDTLPTSVVAFPHAMAAVDGVFDQSEESVSTDWQVAGLEPGIHTLFYRAQDSNGQWGAVSAQFFEIKDPLQPQFGSACSGNTCNFFGDRSLHYDGSITDYHWDFGNGKQSNEQNPNDVIYPEFQAYSVTLTVTDAQGHAVSTTGSVYPFFEGAPIANIVVNCEEMTCQFDATNSSDANGLIASYQWQFMNSEQTTGATTAFTFDEYGDYPVLLTITDESGLKAEAATTVSLAPPASSDDSSQRSSGGGGTWSITMIFLMVATFIRRGAEIRYWTR